MENLKDRIFILLILTQRACLASLQLPASSECEGTSPLRLFPYILRVILTTVPLQWISPDICSDGVQFIFISDNTLKIISLPDRHSSGIADFIDLFGNGGFK
jgi:hypothetical protein